MRAIVLVPALLGVGVQGVAAQEPVSSTPLPQIVDVPACRAAPANRRCALGMAMLTPRSGEDEQDRYMAQSDRYRLPADEKSAEIKLGFAKVTASMPF